MQYNRDVEQPVKRADIYYDYLHKLKPGRNTKVSPKNSFLRYLLTTKLHGAGEKKEMNSATVDGENGIPCQHGTSQDDKACSCRKLVCHRQASCSHESRIFNMGLRCSVKRPFYLIDMLKMTVNDCQCDFYYL